MSALYVLSSELPHVPNVVYVVLSDYQSNPSLDKQ